MKIELTSSEAMLVSCAVGAYFRELEKQARRMNPNDTLAKRIVKDSILELGTIYTELEKTIQQR